jgi:hypothetical protein
MSPVQSLAWLLTSCVPLRPVQSHLKPLVHACSHAPKVAGYLSLVSNVCVMLLALLLLGVRPLYTPGVCHLSK